ncbi:uncharacterized protein PFL1_00108 [Pseudozyma flocculosa PF-1]|uniref:Related to Cytochrome P450 4F8 n=1 Tax=Pseudozyma flocculosa TaxID=84751 RepID=A0A5C3EVK0_9BASI|nr:uncharacterized protein PFL1_00108 [Pseudozyma flocculosa PF-1]EPQ31909.1 hypothetical protein PFL1_00108 [Pseudozyma flocculosa PF-1]SPO35179.1 related to Cytochrome P450 4F8 [Pseudozyma flocculosa]
MGASTTSPTLERAMAACASHPVLAASLALVAWVVYKLSISPVVFPSEFRKLPGPKRASMLFGNRVIESADFTYTSPTTGERKTVSGPGMRLLYWAKELGSHIYTFPEPFGNESLSVSDPNALAHILADTETFQSPELRTKIIELLAGEGIVKHYGHVHRKQRKMIGPSFSVEHLVEMTTTFAELGAKMCGAIERDLDGQLQQQPGGGDNRDGWGVVDMGNWLDCVMLDIIGQTGFGHNFDALDKGRDGSELSAAFNDANQLAINFSLGRMIQTALAAMLYVPAVTWPIERVNRALHKSKQVISKYSQAIVQEKKREILREMDVSGSADDVLSGRKDLLSLLVKANLAEAEADRMSDEDVAGQIHTFTFAGYETSSVTSGFVLYYLSTYPHIQQKLRDALDKGFRERRGIPLRDVAAQDIKYDDLWSDEFEYLDRVIQETLRLCPPVIYSQRLVVKDSVLPLLLPIKSRDGSETITSVPVKKGSVVSCMFKSANYREDLYGEDAEEFNPDRWLKLPELFHKARMPQPYGMFSFSGGPKSCIGSRFSLTEMKTVLILALSKFEFTLAEGIDIRPHLALVVRPRAQTKDGTVIAGVPLRVRKLQ